MNYWQSLYERWQSLQPEQFPWLGEVFLIVLGTLIVSYVVKRILAGVQSQLSKTKNLWDDAMLEAARAPLSVMIWLWGLNWALNTIGSYVDVEIFEVVDEVRKVLVIAVITWFLTRLTKMVQERAIENVHHKHGPDQTSIVAIGKLVRTAVVITGGLVILQTMGYSISGVLAFGGIGGIAVGFAAKDMLANFFGGLMIHMDRPFKIGDWIRSPDKNIEGTVEDIGWRQTRIRTFDLRPLYVPNSTFIQISVENPSRMLNRRIYETVGLRYQDAAVVGEIVKEVREMLLEHGDIDTDQTLMVNFNGFGASSLDFFVYCFTKTVNWQRYHEVKQDVLLKIMDIIHEHDADVAFPTRTLHWADAPEEPGKAEDEAAPRKGGKGRGPDVEAPSTEGGNEGEGD